MKPAVTGEQHRQTVKSLFPVSSYLTSITDKALVTGLVKQTLRYFQHMVLLIRYIILGVRIILIKSFPSLLKELSPVFLSTLSQASPTAR